MKITIIGAGLGGLAAGLALLKKGFDVTILEQAAELKLWAAVLKAYRAQDWDECDVQLLNLQRMNATKYLYQLYADRVASMRQLPFDPGWDGATNFETK